MTTETANVPTTALDFLAVLVLPSGETLGASWERDRWLLDDVLRPALARRDDGLPLNKYAWIEQPKGSGKTTTAAALALVEAAIEPGTEVFVLAVDSDQAALLLDALASMVARSRRLRDLVQKRGSAYRLPNRSFIRVMSSDEASFHGIGVTARRLRFVLDELGQWPSRRLYDAALASSAKTRDSALWVLTNAGIAGSWQAEARDQLEAAGAYLFVTPPGWLPSWVSRADVDALRLTMPEPLWRRYFDNQWVAEFGAAVEAAEWDACLGAVPALGGAERVVVGLDAATKHDTFAATVVSRGVVAAPRQEPRSRFVHVVGTNGGGANPIERGGLRPDEREDRDEPDEKPEVWVRLVKVWTPDRGPLDFEEPYRWLVEFCRTHEVMEICCDPWQLHRFAQELRMETGVWVSEFEQGPARARADADLLSLIRARRLRHDGDPVLREHVLNAALKVGVANDSTRLVKAAPARKIDAAIALSMSAGECLRLNL